MAVTQTYVDYGAGNDAIGDGSIGAPWKTLQHAFDNCVRNTADGNQVNLKAGTAHINAAPLDLTTFIAAGALSAAAPLIIRGYTATANDGGTGEIDCGGATMFATTTYDYVRLIDLDVHTFGDAAGIVLDAGALLARISVHKGASTPTNRILVTTGTRARVLGCHIYDQGTVNAAWYPALQCGSEGAIIVGNYIAAVAQGVYALTSGEVRGNIITISNGSIWSAIYGNMLDYIFDGNIIYCTDAAATKSGIMLGGANRWGQVITNNIICGYSGVGGSGIDCTSGHPYMLGPNAFYNNTATVVGKTDVGLDLTANDVALAADPFTDAANGDFSLTAAAKLALADKGFPTQYLGAHANTNPHITIGAMQQALATGGGFPKIASVLGRTRM